MIIINPSPKTMHLHFLWEKDSNQNRVSNYFILYVTTSISSVYFGIGQEKYYVFQQRSQTEAIVMSENSEFFFRV